MKVYEMMAAIGSETADRDIEARVSDDGDLVTLFVDGTEVAELDVYAIPKSQDND